MQGHKAESKLFQSQNISRCSVWFVHDVLFHPRAGQLLLPDDLTQIGLKRANTGKILTQYDTTLKYTKQLDDVWLDSALEEGSVQYSEYATTAAVDMYLMLQPSKEAGNHDTEACLLQ